ncbi:MAG: hypothetical protein LBR33_03630 [Propionibacteriaceae bacterium]|jgi:hypothetical protein|nr:hypothetical protein [Propionibacteriaceae bacterium]
MPTTARTTVKAIAAGLAVIVTLGLAACGSDEPDLPSVGGSAGASTAAGGDGTADRVAAAQKLHDCLADVDIATTYENDADGLPSIVNFAADAQALAIDLEGLPMISAAVSEDDLDKFYDGVDWSGTPEARLQYDGIDRTDDWVRCLNESGYSQSDVLAGILGSPLGVDLMQRSVEANNEWAACARANGFPETKDSQMPAKFDGTEYPAALLPSSITEDQLRALLEVCPNFDGARMTANAQYDTQFQSAELNEISLPDDYYVAPTIGFDYPGFDYADVNILTGGQSAPNDATAQKLSALDSILNEALYDWYAAQSGVLPTAAAS